jgi:hypothetical protein
MYPAGAEGMRTGAGAGACTDEGEGNGAGGGNCVVAGGLAIGCVVDGEIGIFAGFGVGVIITGFGVGVIITGFELRIIFSFGLLV